MLTRPSFFLSFLPPQSLAVDISLAALLGEDVYNFGELLLHPIVSAGLPLRCPCQLAAAATLHLEWICR